MEHIQLRLLRENVSWNTIVSHIGRDNAANCFTDLGREFALYIAAHVVTILSAIPRVNPSAVAQQVFAMERLRGFNERIYSIRLRTYECLNDAIDTTGCNMLYLVTKPGGMLQLKSMKDKYTQSVCNTYILRGDPVTPGLEVYQTTFGGMIHSMLHNTKTWGNLDYDANHGGFFSRLYQGITVSGHIANVMKSSDSHDIIGVRVVEEYGVKNKKAKNLLYRCDPGNIADLYPWLDESEESSLFREFLDEIKQRVETAWNEIRDKRLQVVRPAKRMKMEDVELDFETFPLTANIPDFTLKNQSHVQVAMQNIASDFMNQYFICCVNGERFEYESQNAVVYRTPRYVSKDPSTNECHEPITNDRICLDLKNHFSRHLREESEDPKCIGCKYELCVSMMKFAEADAFFMKCSEVLASKSGKAIFGEIQGTNEGRSLDKKLVCFMNTYFDIESLTFIPPDQIDNLNRIAVCNQTTRFVDPVLMNATLTDENFYDRYKHMIPVFKSFLGQGDDITKILLADIGSGFIPRGVYDHYQKATFILGPGGRGKTELLKIIRAIHGPSNCVTPCQNTLGQKFSHGQFAGSLAVAYLPDEISKKCGLSQQMLYNFIDQTPIRCEIKFKQQLVTLPFELYICWVANSFFSDYEATEALLRRVLCIDVHNFTFVKFDKPPSNLVEAHEVYFLVYLTYLTYITILDFN